MFISIILWSLPVIFMLHDFEEIIMTDAWQKKNQTKLNMSQFKPFNHWKSTASGAVAVLVEFIILVVVALITSIFQSYLLWLMFNFIFIIHFLIHYYFSIKFRGYIPGLTTALLFIPFSLYSLIYMWLNITSSFFQVLPIVILSLLIALVFFKCLTKSITMFFNFLEHYSKI